MSGLMRRLLSLGLLMLVASGCTTRRARVAPTEVTHSTYIVRLGVDTIMVETFSASPGVIEGDIVDRSPTTSLLHYTLLLDTADRVRQFAATMRAAPGAPATPTFRARGDRTTDGFDVVVQEGDSIRRKHVPAPAEAIPLFARSIGLYELVTARVRHAGVDSIAVPVLDLEEIRIVPRVVRTLGTDSVLLPLIFPRGEHARVDAAGRILGVSGLATSFKWVTERVPDVDLGALTRSFAARDARGASLGTYSSRDTVRAVVDGARITIDYGRPAKRGRVIFGGLVPWGEVWRTGADLATHLTTDHALNFTGLVVPAGTYTLYTLPSPTTWKLIVNRRTGQLGLLYDVAADLGRIDMTTAVVPTVAERLTISVAPALVGGGVLRIAWDQLAATVPFTVLSR